FETAKPCEASELTLALASTSQKAFAAYKSQNTELPVNKVESVSSQSMQKPRKKRGHACSISSLSRATRKAKRKFRNRPKRKMTRPTIPSPSIISRNPLWAFITSQFRVCLRRSDSGVDQKAA